MQDFVPTPSYFFTGQHFLETFTLLSETTRTTNSRWLQRLSPQTANTTFATLMANISPSHIQQCLNLTMHFSLRHLAAKMLSPLFHNFISFPYFFTYYETCSINLNFLIHAAIKNRHKTFRLRTSLSHLFTFKTLRGSNQTHARTLQLFLAKKNKIK